jgi:hypothetical protein
MSACFKSLLESTIEEPDQVTTLPPLNSRIRSLVTSSPALPPSSATDSVLAPDNKPSLSALDHVVVPRENSLHSPMEPQFVVPGNLSNILSHHYLASELENASAIPDSSSTFLPQSRLFSSSDSKPASGTPPSSILSVTSGPSVFHDPYQTSPSRIWTPTVCSRCKQSGHVAKDHCKQCNDTGHVASDHCNKCGETGHRHSDHCYHCRSVGDCAASFCVNTVCERCGETGHPAYKHCGTCTLTTHSLWDHCQVCDIVSCHATKHCYVCEDVGHTSEDHCALCKDYGHTLDDHCPKCKQLGHGFDACLESEPVSIELCWTCRSYGHNRHSCPYRHQSKLRSEWAYQLKRKVMHAHDHCKCCREHGYPDLHEFRDCPKMTHRIGCLKKTHVSSECIEWMERSRKKGSYKDASTQDNLAEYSTEVDLRTFDTDEGEATVPTYQIPPNIFTVTSVSTQTAFVEISVVGELDQVDEITRATSIEQPPNNQTATALEEQDEVTRYNEAVWQFESDWHEYSGHGGPLRNRPISQKYDREYSPEIIMPTRDQQDTFERALIKGNETPAVQSLYPDREEPQRNLSPEENINIKVENTGSQQEIGNSSAEQAIMERNLPVKSEATVVGALSPDVQDRHHNRFPVRTMTEIRNEHVPSFIIQHAHESRVEVASSTLDGKRPRELTSITLPADKRQKTTSDAKAPRPATTSDVTRERLLNNLNEGVWLDKELHIQWRDLCFMAILDAPHHSTNLRQLHNLVSNWVANTFPIHTSIHNQAYLPYLAMIMKTSPHIESHNINPTSKQKNPIDFSIRKDAIRQVALLVKDFTRKLAQLKYQMCILHYKLPNTKPRPRISFENLIGMALHNSGRNCLSEEELSHWIAANIPGYDCDGWQAGMVEELHASSFFFEQRISGEQSGQWSFQEDCADYFEKREPKDVLTIEPNSSARVLYGY